MRNPGRHLFLRLHGYGTARPVRLRPRADRATRGAPPLRRRGGERGGGGPPPAAGPPPPRRGGGGGGGPGPGRAAQVRGGGGAAGDADTVVEIAAGRMGRALRAEGVRDVLLRNLEHPRWEEVAGRCLACANCTLVCPTCFCATVEDTTDLAGVEAERVRCWDSCFTLDHSHLHGGPVRTSIKSRYRQWLTHKVAWGIDQFGMSGCVGCGRCITWCPVGIDLTEEVAAIRAGTERQEVR